ncbi:DNA-processing protein DprA [Rhizobium phaseoli]|uniref:DNA-processing protein DprA n=1 Tax=Rhizobium phaseoli TaxID=396 RepID=UPI000F878746|nr:DNA-processing protein DprA [Rhizobium phaseoli]RUM13489.1 DNA-processing protein DprA [Rhizobium phaseoli]
MQKTQSKTTVAIVALMRIRGIGRRAAVRIVERPIRTADDVQSLHGRVARQKIDAHEFSEAWKIAEESLEKDRAAGITAVSFYDDDFPQRLRKIPDPPAALFMKGDTAALSHPKALAVVGTREPTDYGERVAFRLAEVAVNEGFVIVSGLAHGCDTFAHRGCVEARGRGIAVLAHGLDKIYPAANKGLARDLLEMGGVLVSEYPVGKAPVRTAFAERDRLQSGLSDGVLVIETDVTGGTMHTVRFAQAQKRALACIYHPANWSHEPKTQGNRLMISERVAVPIADREALVDFLGTLQARRETSSTRSETQTDMGF